MNRVKVGAIAVGAIGIALDSWLVFYGGQSVWLLLLVAVGVFAVAGTSIRTIKGEPWWA